MTHRARLTLEFKSYWVSGTGAARGRDVDVVTHRDRDLLPAMPMTQVKGQLRETAARLASAGVGDWSDPLVVELFGPPAAGPGSGEGPGGALALRGEARLPLALRSWLAHPDQAAHRKALFKRLPATAIGPLGAALDRSLRAVEAVIPLTLEGFVDWIGFAPPSCDWVKALDLACSATLALGKLKTDGYGRVIATVVTA